MKKTSAILLAISFLMLAGGCSEKTTETIQERNGLYYVANETTPFTGTFETKFSNGQKETESNFKDGKLDGLATTWFESGQKEPESNFKDGMSILGDILLLLLFFWFLGTINKEWRFFVLFILWSFGQFFKEEPHDIPTTYTSADDGSKQTVTEIYASGHGKKKEEVNYKDGKLNGLATFWFENGQKKEEVNNKDDKIIGLQILWFENGQKKAEFSYKDGKADGLGTLWFENGQKQGEANFKDGKENGLTTRWFENGQKQGEANYIDGKINGLMTRWYENGQKESETTFKDGVEIDGSVTEWSESGRKKGLLSWLTD